MEFEVSMNITFDILYYIFQILDTEDVPVKQIMSCLPILSQKRWKWYCHHHHHHHHHQKKKKHNFLRKTKKYLEKPPVTLENYIQISQMKEKTNDSWACVFCNNLVITAYALKDDSYLKAIVHPAMGVFLKYVIVLELGEMQVLMICLN